MYPAVSIIFRIRIILTVQITTRTPDKKTITTQELGTSQKAVFLREKL